jgi:hypothetical protein
MQLAQPNNVGQQLNQKLDDFSLAGGKVKSNETALALVIQDTQRAEKFVMARLWMSEWRVAKSLYEAPCRQTYWRDTLVPRSCNSFPLVSQHVRAILDQAMPAIFPGPIPFDLQPNPGTPRQVARAWKQILGYQLRQSNVKAQMRLIVKDAEIFGTGIGKFGWREYDEIQTKYRRTKMPKEIQSSAPGGKTTFIHTAETDEMEEYDVPVRVSKPYLDRVEINHVLVSPGLREPDIRQAEYVIYRSYPTIRELNRWRDFEGFQIPSEAELKSLAAPPTEQAPSSGLENEGTSYPTQGHRPLPRYLDESEDPLEHKLEVLEHWTKDRVIVVLQRKLTIRNEGNPLGVIPFVSCYWDDLPGTFYAFGIPRRIGGVQTHIQGLRNLRLDDIHMNLQNMWKARKGSNIAAQPIKQYPGAVFKVDGMEDIEAIEKQPILAEAYKEEEVLIADTEKTTGANELLIQGSMPSGNRSTGMRTATGAGAVSGASSARVQSFVDVICDQCLLPVVYSFLKMDRMWLDPALMRQIIGKTLWESMEGEHGVSLLTDMCNNDDIQLTLLAGSNIAAKSKMGQSLPLYGQILEAPAVQQGLAAAGFKVNWLEWSRRWEETSGWDSPDEMFIPQTDEDKQKAMASNPKVLDAQATRARLDQMHGHKMQQLDKENQNKLQQIDAKGQADAGVDVATKAIDRASLREETPGIVEGFQSLGGE